MHRDRRLGGNVHAWCHGDLGVSVALWRGAVACGDAEGATRALALALRCAAGVDALDAVADASLCHGSAGTAHLLHRWYAATGEPRFADAARAALRRTLALVHAGVATEKPGLLVGAAGVALVLLASLTGERAWDAPLLADPLGT